MKKKLLHAVAWASGKIEFTTAPEKKESKGAIKFASGTLSELKKSIYPLARLAYDNHTLLVPGVPEASGQDEGLTALTYFTKQVLQRLENIRKS